MSKFYALVALVALAKAPSPWGPVWIAATDRGIAAAEPLSTEEGFVAGLVRRGLVTAPDRAGEHGIALAREAAERISAALEGEDAGLDTLPIDIDDRPAWDRLVLAAVRAIPRGQTAGYGEVARRIGRAGAARAVGGAVGRNPVGLLVPCHRVIAGDGTLGGYGAAAWGGREAALDVKRALLALEGVRVVNGRVSPR
ncbi:MAG TPA: methylated-DNA--[protein]-cysteine S-methyltransferase [Candidatus Limnocylindrales bacterium]|nr:methylated-DNA--[protein]-cysteine S-methyltransferase [Candidatus Limnocylindrales bacterium]